MSPLDSSEIMQWSSVGHITIHFRGSSPIQGPLEGSATIFWPYFVCQSMPEYAKVCKGMPESNWVLFQSGILWHTLAYSGILLHSLAYSCILLHTFAYTGILSHTLAYKIRPKYGFGAFLPSFLLPSFLPYFWTNHISAYVFPGRKLKTEFISISFIDLIVWHIVLQIFPFVSQRSHKFVTAFILNIVLVKYISCTIEFEHV